MKRVSKNGRGGDNCRSLSRVHRFFRGTIVEEKIYTKLKFRGKRSGAELALIL